MNRTSWDPEVEQILVDIARDDRSGLRELPPATIGELLRPRPISDRAAFLSKAERHLLAVHRETVADLMVDIAFGMMFGPGGYTDRCSNFETDSHVVDVPQPAEVGRRLVQLPNGRKDPEVQEAVALAKTALRARDSGRAHPGQLLSLSLRLLPTVRARLLLVAHLARTGQPRSGIRMAQALLDLRLSTLQRANAWEYLGFGYSELGDRRGAMKAYRNSCRVAPYPLPACSYFFNAVQVGEEQHVERAVGEIRRMWGDASRVVAWFVRTMDARRRRGDWRPTSRARSIVSEARVLTSDEMASLVGVFGDA